MKTHFHFLIWCATRLEAGTGNYIDNTACDVLCETSEQAIEKAKRLVPGKAIYAVRQVIEHFEGACTNHGGH